MVQRTEFAGRLVGGISYTVFASVAAEILQRREMSLFCRDDYKTGLVDFKTGFVDRETGTDDSKSGLDGPETRGDGFKTGLDGFKRS
jgi:hypothetical protein